MAALPDDGVITVDGDYDVGGLIPGVYYLLNFSSETPVGFGATISFNTLPEGAFTYPDNSVFGLPDGDRTSDRFRCPSSANDRNTTMRISVYSLIAPIRVSVDRLVL